VVRVEQARSVYLLVLLGVHRLLEATSLCLQAARSMLWEEVCRS